MTWFNASGNLDSLSLTEKNQAATIIESRLNSGEILLCLRRESLRGVALRFIVPFAFGVGIAFLLMTSHGAHGTPRGFLLWLAALAIFPVMAVRALAGQVFAITNQRLICLSLKKKDIVWWINLDALMMVEIKRGNSLRFCVSRQTFAMTAHGPAMLPILDYTLKGIEKPEEIGSLLAPYVADLTIVDKRKPDYPRLGG